MCKLQLKSQWNMKNLCSIIVFMIVLLASLFSSALFGYEFDKNKPPFEVPSPPDGLTIVQQKSWNDLQSYNAWLYYRPDFDSFYKYFIRTLDDFKLTLQQVNAGLYNKAIRNGGDFSLVYHYIDSWYRSYSSSQVDVGIDLDFCIDIISLANNPNHHSVKGTVPQLLFPLPSSKKFSSYTVIKLSFIFGLVFSCVIVIVLKRWSVKPSQSARINREKENNSSGKEDYIDVEFTEIYSDDGFD